MNIAVNVAVVGLNVRHLDHRGTLVKRYDGDAIVPLRQGVRAMDVRVADGAERGGVRFAGYCRWRHFADLAHPHALVARGELVSAMNASVARGAKEGGVRPAEDEGRDKLTRVARFRHAG